MSHPEPRIQCSNPHCAASNSLEARLCEQCATPIIRRYLWSTEQIPTGDQKNTLIEGRYLVLDNQIFLDTQPSTPPTTPEEVDPKIVVYLQLFPCYPHVPQVYSLLNGTKAWLLDLGTVPVDESGNLVYPQQLIPRIGDLWSNGSSLQQLNWLWQITKLWKPLLSKNVASTLLEADLIGINGLVLQLLQLNPDGEHQPSLKELGNLWSRWAKTAQPNVRSFIEQLAARLETGAINQASQIIAVLDLAIAHCRKSHQYSYQTYALSDSGPSRTNNEDAAYPTQGHPKDTIHNSENTLALVCDGVGGHDGGEIASTETVEYLQSKISQLIRQQYSSGKILSKIAQYINEANDIISKRNDSEQRQERQRMGTTLVMAFARAQEMYLGHVGDSRIYWITGNSCHQITVDDDLASREVRLGYALYRDSLQYPSAGALIQALGMRDSAALHPNLQRYIIDDDCIFLLCTDGLSDFDRVEQQWRKIVLPVLNGKQDLVSAAKNLIALANEKNGHDNVTVALVHCQVKPLADEEVSVSWQDVESVLKESKIWSDTNLTDSMWSDTTPDPVNTTSAEAETSRQQIGEPLPEKSQPKWLKTIIFLLIASTIIGTIVWLFAVKAPDNDNPPYGNEVENQE